MAVIIGDGKNKGVEIFTNDKKSEGNNVVFAFHGTPLIKLLADKIWKIEEGYKAESKVFMPYTEEWTSTMSQARLEEEMDKYYQLTKQDLLEAKTIDVVAHSYGPIKALAFLHAIANDKTDGEKILAKVKNLHLYNGMINMEWDENHGIMQNIKVFIFKIRAFFCSLLRGEFNPEMPDVVKSLINLNKLKEFKPVTFIAYNPDDLLAPSSEQFMKKVRTELKNNITGIRVVNDSNLVQYTTNKHGTGTGLVRRFEEVSKTKSDGRNSNRI